ncbi:C10 family peptidase [Pedobacter sp. P26]|uniref:C10 family peptidase n=1 Tax=Pedobacter sp. P26 TaxID=3423956 RepID=UPI003D671A22
MQSKSTARQGLFKATLIFSICLSIYSCKKGNDAEQSVSIDKTLLEITPAEYASIAYDNPKELSTDEIKKVIQAYPLKDNPATKGSNDIQFEVAEKYYIDQKGALEKASVSPATKSQVSDNKIAVYNVNITSGNKTGSALVCADERAPVVLAYMPVNHLRPELLGENLMYQSSKRYITDRLVYIGHLRDSLRSKTLSKLEEKLGKLPEQDVFSFVKNKIRVQSTAPKTKSPVESWLPTQVISQVGPFATTEWDQSGVADQLLPSGSTCTRVPAGCLVIAGAQVLAQLAPTFPVIVRYETREVNIPGAGHGGVTRTITIPIYENVNWPYLKANPFIGYYDPQDKQTMYSRLIRDIFNRTQTIPSCEGSGTQMQKMIDLLRNYIDIDNPAGFNVQQIKASLDNNRSVIAAGSRLSGTEKIRHAWVVDGYAICDKMNGSTPGDLVHQYDLYLHANLGWGGSDTGWFLVGTDWNLSFDVAWDTRQYGLDMQMATNARNK